MIAPSPYGRPPREPAKRNSGSVLVPSQPPQRRVKPAFTPCPDADLDRDLLRKFAAAGRVCLAELMDGFKPKWAWAAYERCLERGLLAEDDYDARVSLTPAGRAELEGGK